MKRVNDHIRDHLLVGITTWEELANVERQGTLEEMQRTQWSDDFEKHMRTRLIMGRFRYGGNLQTKSDRSYDSIGSAICRLQRYQGIEGGNDEDLVDAANLCLVEYCIGAHPNKHFEASDDGEHVQRRGEIA